MNSSTTILIAQFRTSFQFDLLPFLITFLPVITFPFISMLLFPFYITVSKKHRERDKQTAIYPFTSYFYKATCITEPLCFIGGIAFFVNYLRFGRLLTPFWYFYWILLAVFKLNVALMLNFLTSVLAIHRSILYFFPKIVEALPMGKTTAKWVIWLLNLPSITLIFKVTNFLGRSWKNGQDSSNLVIFQFSLYGIVLLSTIPYLLIFLNVRKLTKMTPSNCNPERFIKYQIVIIIVGKLCMLPCIIWISLLAGGKELGAFTFLGQLLCEASMAPLLIQSAYLLSNKGNLDSLKSICCWKRKRRGKVEPTSVVYTVPTETVFAVETRV